MHKDALHETTNPGRITRTDLSTQNLADTAAMWLTIAALSCGVITFLIWLVPMSREFAFAIEWIEITAGDTICKQFLKPGDDPEALFKAAGTGVTAREYCNVHGLWKS